MNKQDPTKQEMVLVFFLSLLMKDLEIKYKYPEYVTQFNKRLQKVF
jgi:hypothetical protein